MESIPGGSHCAAVENALSDALLLLDMSCRVTRVNDAFTKMTGYDPEAVINMDVADLARLIFEPEISGWFVAKMDLARKGQASCAEPAIVVSKDGQKIPSMCSVDFASDGQGKPEAVVVVLEDVSESRKVEQELRNANVLLSKALTDLKRTQQQVIHSERLNAVGQMASGIAHDFNNSLMPILGFSELLLKRPQMLDDREETLSMLKDIHAAAKDAAATIRRLRDFYRQPEDSGWTPVDLNKMAESVVALTQPKWRGVARSRGISIDIRLKLGEIPKVSVNESQMREALTNLMLNAIDALPKGGIITIETGVDREWVRISIADNGIGMSDEVQLRVFEPFFTTKGGQGTGMGLAVTHGIVRQHGGRIEFRSRLENGTTFDLYFPLSREAERKVAPSERPGSHLDLLRVLCIDDEQWSREVMKRFFTYNGHSVVLADSGASGLEEFSKGHFDLVIVDRAMPDMSGDVVAAAVKKARPNTPVLLVTGFGEIMKDTGETPEGVDAILSKPVGQEELSEAVSRLMDGG